MYEEKLPRVVSSLKTQKRWRRVRSSSSPSRAAYWSSFIVTVLLGFQALLGPGPDTKPPYWARVRDVMELNFDKFWTSCAGHDDYVPATNVCEDWLYAGATALDSIDTLLIMGLRRQYRMVRDWAAGQANFGVKPLHLTQHRRVVFFELVIRALGGLNSAYALSHDPLWLDHARKLGDALLPAFNASKTNCPLGLFVVGSNQSYRRFSRNVADAGSLQLEFRALASNANDPRYAEGADKCMRALVKALQENVPVTDSFDVRQGVFLPGTQQIGASVDSFVEYLLKGWIAFGKRDDALRSAFVNQAYSILKQLVSVRNGTVFVGERHSHYRTKLRPIMSHLACFWPGNIALAYMHGVLGTDALEMAKKLTRTCYRMASVTGVGVEAARIREDGKLLVQGDTSLLRPEIIESVYMMWKATGDEMYMQWARKMWDDFERMAIMKDGRISNVVFDYTNATSFSIDHEGKLESFVFAETLKYFWLIFSDSSWSAPGLRINLHRMVFNTEAHPITVFDSPPGAVLA